MELFATGGITVAIIILAVVALVAFGIIALIMRAWVKVARADEALVISGRKQRYEVDVPVPQGDGTVITQTQTRESSVTVIVNGRAIVNPITQRAETISLRSRQVTLQVGAQSLDNVTLEVDSVAILKIGSEPSLVRAAAERFASQDKAIEQFTTEQLEGALRGVVATLTVTELMRERAKFSAQIAEEVKEELREQGLVLDSFQIKGITDRNGYIESLGAPEIESKKQAASIAQTNAERAVNQREIANREANLIEQTALDKNAAAAQSEVGRARAQAEQAEALARAQAEQAVLQQEAENRQAQLDADVKKVADAEKYRAQTEADTKAYQRVKEAEADAAVAAQEAQAVTARAQAEAEAVRLAGEAEAAAIEAKGAALAKNQAAVLAQRALEITPELMSEFAKGFANIGSVSIIGGSGSDTGSEMISAASGGSLRGVFETIRESTGIDLAEIVQGRAVGRAVGEGISQVSSPDVDHDSRVAAASEAIATQTHKRSAEDVTVVDIE